jgi:hypothetical protein
LSLFFLKFAQRTQQRANRPGQNHCLQVNQYLQVITIMFEMNRRSVEKESINEHSLSLRPFFITIGIADWMTPRPFIYSGVAPIVASLC